MFATKTHSIAVVATRFVWRVGCTQSINYALVSGCWGGITRADRYTYVSLCATKHKTTRHARLHILYKWNKVALNRFNRSFHGDDTRTQQTHNSADGIHRHTCTRASSAKDGRRRTTSCHDGREWTHRHTSAETKTSCFPLHVSQRRRVHMCTMNFNIIRSKKNTTL